MDILLWIVTFLWQFSLAIMIYTYLLFDMEPTEHGMLFAIRVVLMVVSLVAPIMGVVIVCGTKEFVRLRRKIRLVEP